MTKTSVWCALGLLVCFLSLSSVVAQPPQGPPRQFTPEDMDETMKKLTERLQLDEERAKEVRAIMESSRKERNAVREEFRERERSQETMQQMRAEMDKIRKGSEEKLAKILSEDQMKEYQKFEQERREEMRSRMGRRRPN